MQLRRIWSCTITSLSLCLPCIAKPLGGGNDDCSSAQPLTSGVYSGLSLYDLFSHPNQWDTDYDWYRFTVQPGEELFVEVHVDSFSGSYFYSDFVLYEAPPGSCPGALISSADVFAQANTQYARNTTAVAKDYLVRLDAFSSSDNQSFSLNYTLSVAIQPVACPNATDDGLEPNGIGQSKVLTPGAYTNLFAKYSNEDWYRVLVPAHAALNVQITFQNALGDLDLGMLSGFPAGTQSNGTGNVESVSVQNIFSLAQEITFRVHPKSGLFGVCNAYDLSVSIDEPAIGASYCIAAPNSTGLGAYLGAQGSRSVSSNNLVFVASGLPPNASALLYDGTLTTQVPFGDGYRCVAGTTHRLATRTTPSTGVILYALDNTLLPPSTVFVRGSTWNFQVYYRNIAGPLGTGFNLSSGFTVQFQP